MVSSEETIEGVVSGPGEVMNTSVRRGSGGGAVSRPRSYSN